MPIIGNGDIASALKDREDRLYFASGVSNSAETRGSEFLRESTLLLKQDRSSHLVYFSSLCIFYLSTPYSRHKMNMESIVKINFEKYTIIRLGNINWGSNPYTIINYLKNKIRNNEPFKIQDTYRYIINKEEFLHWIDLIPDWSCEMNVPGELLTINEIVRRIKLCLL